MEAKFGTRLAQIQMKFFIRTVGCTFFDHKSIEEILEEVQLQPVDGKLRRYKSEWLRRLARMNSSRMAKIVLNCRPN